MLREKLLEIFSLNFSSTVLCNNFTVEEIRS